jgi:hypothetical protein
MLGKGNGKETMVGLVRHGAIAAEQRNPAIVEASLFEQLGG